MNTLKEIIETDLSTTLGNRTRSKFFGLEYSGACPWCGGSDRFHVWPDAEDIPGVGTLGRFHCMSSTSGGRGGCGRKGNGIDYLQEKRGLSFVEACQELDIDTQKLIDYRREKKGLPAAARRVKEPVEHKSSLSEMSETWRKQALALVRWASSQLSGEALDYLLGRGLETYTIKNHVLGYYPTYKWVNAQLWGAKKGRMSIPRGIVIPWFDDNNEVICIRVRRLPNDESQEARDHYGVDDRTGEINRYKTLYGSSSHHLYGGELLYPGCYTALFEGELDALIARQEADESISVVATGSTGWARSAISERRLVQSIQVLIAYDANAPGDKAADYWLKRLPNSRRWRPLWSDANDMQQDGINVGEWLMLGFSAMDTPPVHVEDEQGEAFACVICRLDLAHSEDDLGQFAPDGSGPYCNQHYHEYTRQPGDFHFDSQKRFLSHVHAVANGLNQTTCEQWTVTPIKPGYALAQHVAYLKEQRRQGQTHSEYVPRKHNSLPIWLMLNTNEWNELVKHVGRKEAMERRERGLQQGLVA